MAKICEICGNRPARYICQECGRSACEFCFIPERWLCIDCYRKLAYQPPIQPITGKVEIDFPVKLFFIGFIIMFIGTLIIMLSSLLHAASTQGGFIWIFPLPPLFFGLNPNEKWLLTIITVVSIVIFMTIFTLIIYKILKRQI